MVDFCWHREKQDGRARKGRLETAHGMVSTPAFMPVGTAGSVKAMRPESVKETGAEIILANAFHLMLRPGARRIRALGGLRHFMNWSGPILTDSGGFQLMSQAKLHHIKEEGVAISSHIDGSKHFITPESIIDVQQDLGTTISMVLDECTPFPATKEQARLSMQRSMRWAERSKKAFTPKTGHALFGIVQGGVFPELRVESIEHLHHIGFPGYAIGGLAVGEGLSTMTEILDMSIPLIDDASPHYLMGAGKPPDILIAVAHGIDLFDCVLPARSGRTGQAFTRYGAINILNARYKDDKNPLEEDCPCPACRGYSRAFLRHMMKSKEILGAMLLTWHNLQFYQRLMQEIRDAISEEKFSMFLQRFLHGYQHGQS